MTAAAHDLTLADLGVAAETTAVLDVGHAAKVAATLDRPAPADGDRLPSLWHWAWFTPTAPTADLGPDGHPRLGSPRLADFPRRMWGAGSLTWPGELRVGEPATKRTELAGVREVSGRSGALLLVTLRHEVHQRGVVQVREEQSIVYRAQGDPIPMPEGDVTTETPEGGWREVVAPEPPLLLRFSAVTFNAHRIHYDLAYAREVEGYPGLVVHGPLTSMLLAGFVEARTGRRLAGWTFKATAPLFAGRPVTLTAAPEGDDDTKVAATATRHDGTPAMSASAALVAS